MSERKLELRVLLQFPERGPFYGFVDGDMFIGFSDLGAISGKAIAVGALEVYEDTKLKHQGTPLAFKGTPLDRVGPNVLEDKDLPTGVEKKILLKEIELLHGFDVQYQGQYDN